ncbi:serine/threonine protein kinase [Longilinea arvoryzae]|uniref:non-specific serine/threonine protein kinase n=1 Tax=Longilinea arvoryzae TaxID=360412 RepID=A0A0S7BGQ7_9CHLR|nr:protein kinase [Longilinea arvoryzae]GAP12634.1 serine/threonine protein kinase [Longilinea arvoryzae]
MGADRWVGQVIGGRYQIEELVGQGGMSAVYKARDPNLQRTVAIKLIHSHLSDNEEFVRRFESEATAIARLRHPNIVQVYDFNHDGDTYFMVLEFVAGETLQARIKRLNAAGRFVPIREAMRAILDICKAADYAHQRGMIHRDIKPANIMLDVSGDAILMDFGIARILGGQAHTATGAVLGTALYMSPEQIQGLHPDARSDIYSIGVTLFETLGRRPPFEADSAMTLMMMHLHDPVPDLSQLHPGIPEDVRAIVNRALEKDRNDRYQSCAEMAAAIEEALKALPDDKAARVPAPVSAPVEKPTPPPVSAPASAEGFETQVEPAPPAPKVRPEKPARKPKKAPEPIPEPAPVREPASVQEQVVEKEPVLNKGLETIVETPPAGFTPPKSVTPPKGVTPLKGVTPSSGLPPPGMMAPVGSTAAAETFAQAGPVAQAQAAPAAAPPLTRARRKLPLAAILAAAVVVLGGGGFLLFQQFAPAGGRPTQVPLVSPPTVTVEAVFPTQAPAPTATLEPSPEPTLTPAPSEAPLPTATAAAAILPPTTGGADLIAYLQNSEIWTAHTDGSNVKQLTSDGTLKKYLRWLPGGQALSYISGKCLETVNLTGGVTPITCFNNAVYFDSFEPSPDGKHVALSLDRQLYLLPFDLERLSKADSHPDLVAIADCADLAPYQRSAVLSSRWSKDGTLLAALAIGVLADGTRGDLVQLFAVDRCIPNPKVQLQFPEPHFALSEYTHKHTLPGLTWDGEALFVLNGLTRNDVFGDLHIFNRESFSITTNANPVNGVCCYANPTFSPDGKYLLFAFQDITLGANSQTRLYYIPFGNIGTGAKFEPLPLPEFSDPKEAPQAVLRPAE